MIVFLNGAFGVGKTSVAKALRRIFPGSVIANPEHMGALVLLLPGWLKLAGQNSGDYQDMPLWRNLTAAYIRAARLVGRTVFVPMAFTNRAYLDEIMDKARRFDSDRRHFCLVAPLATVEGRLRQRGDAPRHLEWQLRRARECCAAHVSEDFAVKIDAATRGTAELALEIAARLR